MNKIKLSSIVAIAKNNVIGKDNDLIWHIPEDLKHFKRTTLGKPILMGRKSYDSLGRPLPGRPNIVVSRAYKDIQSGEETPLFKEMEAVDAGAKPKVNEGPFLYASIEDGIEAAKKMAEEMGLDEIFITGGGEIYKQTLPYTERLYLTVLDREYEGDTFFPELDWSQWKILSEVRHDAQNDVPGFTIFTLDKA